MPGHRNYCVAMIMLGHPIPQQKCKQLSVVTQSGDKNNTLKSKSNDSYPFLSCNGNSKQSSLHKKSGSNIKGKFCNPKASSILTLSSSQMMILNLMMLLLQGQELLHEVKIK